MMNNCSIAIQVLPQINNQLIVCESNENKNEVYRVVDEVIKYIDSTGVKYVVGPFETVLIGEFDQLFDIIKECQKIAITKGATSTLTYLKVSFNPNGVSTIEEKTDKYK